MKLRLAVAAIAAACCALWSPSAALAQSSAAELVIRIDRLENQLRQLTGMVEQLQYRNQQLEVTLKRTQDDTEARFQELGRGGQRPAARSPAPQASNQPVQSTPAPPPGPPGVPGQRSDAFDPNENPGAPGTPRVLGSLYGSVPASGPAGRRNDGIPAIMADEPAPGIGAPLDLTANAANDPSRRPGASFGQPAPTRGASSNYVVANAPTTGPASTREMFDQGYGHLTHKDFDLAEESFRDFLKRYPSDRLASEAQYFLGESLFQRQDYRDAADAFLMLSKKYETSAKAPDGLLRLGQSLAALNETELACATFGEVVRKYPRVSSGVKQAVEREQKRVRC